MCTSEEIEKAKEYLFEQGYFKYHSFNINSVANLMAEWVHKSKSSVDLIFMEESLDEAIRKDRVLKESDSFITKVHYFKVKSPLYPKIFVQYVGRELFATTLVKFTYEDKNYLRHHLESIVPNKSTKLDNLLDSLRESIDKTLNYGMPSELDDLITN